MFFLEEKSLFDTLIEKKIIHEDIVPLQINIKYIITTYGIFILLLLFRFMFISSPPKLEKDTLLFFESTNPGLVLENSIDWLFYEIYVKKNTVLIDLIFPNQVEYFTPIELNQYLRNNPNTSKEILKHIPMNIKIQSVLFIQEHSPGLLYKIKKFLGLKK